MRFHETLNVQISDHVISMKVILKGIAEQLEIRMRASKVKKKVINFYYQLYSELTLFPLVWSSRKVLRLRKQETWVLE